MSKRQSFSKQMKRPHLSAVRALGYALTLSEHDGWSGFAAILEARLTKAERASLAFWALKSLDPETAELTSTAAHGRGAGMPDASLFGFMDQASFWADMADPDEREAYCLASFSRMAPARQAAFLDFVNGRAAA